MTADREPDIIDDEVTVTISVQIPAHLEAARRQDAAAIVAQQLTDLAWQTTPRFGRLSGVDAHVPDFEPIPSPPVVTKPRVELTVSDAARSEEFVETLKQHLAGTLPRTS